MVVAAVDRVPDMSANHRAFAIDTAPDPLRGLAAGMIAGFVASAVMSGFQALTSGLVEHGGEPATEKAAAKIAKAATGQGLAAAKKPAAGEAVHYAFGAVLGGVYGIAAESLSAVTTGGGSVFGVTVALVVDDTIVPALGLAPPAGQSPPSTHAYAMASHIVFGFALEAARRLLRG